MAAAGGELNWDDDAAAGGELNWDDDAPAPRVVTAAEHIRWLTGEQADVIRRAEEQRDAVVHHRGLLGDGGNREPYDEMVKALKQILFAVQHIARRPYGDHATILNDFNARMMAIEYKLRLMTGQPGIPIVDGRDPAVHAFMLRVVEFLVEQNDIDQLIKTKRFDAEVAKQDVQGLQIIIGELADLKAALHRLHNRVLKSNGVGTLADAKSKFDKTTTRMQTLRGLALRWNTVQPTLNALLDAVDEHVDAGAAAHPALIDRERERLRAMQLELLRAELLEAALSAEQRKAEEKELAAELAQSQAAQIELLRAKKKLKEARANRANRAKRAAAAAAADDDAADADDAHVKEGRIDVWSNRADLPDGVCQVPPHMIAAMGTMSVWDDQYDSSGQATYKKIQHELLFGRDNIVAEYDATAPDGWRIGKIQMGKLRIPYASVTWTITNGSVVRSVPTRAVLDMSVFVNHKLWDVAVLDNTKHWTELDPYYLEHHESLWDDSGYRGHVDIVCGWNVDKPAPAPAFYYIRPIGNRNVQIRGAPQLGTATIAQLVGLGCRFWGLKSQTFGYLVRTVRPGYSPKALAATHAARKLYRYQLADDADAGHKLYREKKPWTIPRERLESVDLAPLYTDMRTSGVVSYRTLGSGPVV